MIKNKIILQKQQDLFPLEKTYHDKIDFLITSSKDLSEGKLTLPVILMLEDLNSNQQDLIFRLIGSGEYSIVKEHIENSNSFEKARIERDQAISNCIEYTERFIKLDKLENIRVFLKETLVA